MAPKPLLLVDIDGVISLFGFPPDHRPDGVWTQVEGTAHVLSVTAATTLLDLVSSEYEPVWCSGWEEKANENLPHLLGLGPWPVLHFDRAQGAGVSVAGHWKLDAIDAHCGPDRPLAWVDDVLDDACRAWAAARRGPTLLVRTDPATGLTPEHAVVLRAWAADL